MTTSSLAVFSLDPKHVFGIACFAVAISALSPATTTGEQPNANRPYAEWVVSYNKAVEQAKQTDRPIMLVFSGSDWCGWCQKLTREVFITHEFARWSTDHVIKVEVDFPMTHQLPEELRMQNQNLKNRFGHEIQTYPTVLFISPTGEVLGKTGYVAGGPKNWIEKAKNVVKAGEKPDLLAQSNGNE